MTSIFDCIVVGAGVAGMTSAIYLKRAGYNILLLEKSAPGGQINMSPKVENYPGFINIDGASLALNIFEQTQKLGIEYKYGNVQSIKKEADIFIIKTDMEEYKTKTVIVATGRSIKKLNIDNEQNLIGKGISYCALCDGYFFKDKNVAIIGTDDRTLEEVIYLANICKKVYLIYNKSEYDNNKSILSKVNNLENIEIKFNRNINEIKSKNDCLYSIITDKKEEIMCDGFFINNGYQAQLDFLNEITTENEYIIVDKKMKTNILGLFACGDIIKKDVYQLTTAIGEATVAAKSVDEYLNMEE